MRRLRKFLRLRFADKLYLISCTAHLAAIATSLRVFGYNRVSAFLTGRLARQRAPLPAARIIWGVRTSAQVLRPAKCLAQAVTLHFLLARAGHVSVIRVGVARDSEMAFDAHAWVVFNGGIVIGEIGATQRGYTPLTDLQLGEP